MKLLTILVISSLIGLYIHINQIFLCIYGFYKKGSCFKLKYIYIYIYTYIYIYMANQTISFNKYLHCTFHNAIY